MSKYGGNHDKPRENHPPPPKELFKWRARRSTHAWLLLLRPFQHGRLHPRPFTPCTKKKITWILKMSTTFGMCLTLMSKWRFAWSMNIEPLLLRGQNGLSLLQSGLEEVTHTRCSFSTDYWIKYEGRGWERGGEKKDRDKGRWGKEPLFE